jgi:glycosyltransferase involved in cell wall biosynthesis
MHVVIASGYHTGSHRQWAEGYADASEHDVSIVSLPGQFWQWRLAGGFVDLAASISDLARGGYPPDLVLATSMVDVAGLRGLLARDGIDVPIALYMHENQITYPPLGRNRTERLYGLVNWTSFLAADGIAFNSAFHFDEVFEALPPLLREMPDERQDHLIPLVEELSTVLPVGCSLFDVVAGPKDDPPIVVWNHRWDRDKDPGTFFRIMQRLVDDGVGFGLALMGERFVKQRADHEEAVVALADRIVVDDFPARQDYVATLGRSTVVMSTAPQEFFGISVVEGMHAGCLPILPARLVYPERVPEHLHDRCLYRSEDHAIDLLTRALTNADETRDTAASLRDETSRYDWSEVAPRYDAWLESVAALTPDA